MFEFKIELLNIEFYENTMKTSKKLNVSPCRVYHWNDSLSQLIKIHLPEMHYSNDTELGSRQKMHKDIKSNFFIILI